MALEFEGRVALVTGGGRGIGRATAMRLAAEGADVAIGYATRTADAEEVVRAVRALGRRSISIQTDVSQPDRVKKLVAAYAR